MASSVRIYTTGSNMKQATVTNSPNEDTGYPIENIFDDNPNTYWRPDSTASLSNIELIFDLGSDPLLIDTLIVFVRDYEQLTQARSFGPIYASYDGANWEDTIKVMNLKDTTGPLRILTLSASQYSYRYWKGTISGASGNQPELSLVYFARSFSFTASNILPEENTDIALVEVDEFPGGHSIVRAVSKNIEGEFSREFLLRDTTDLELIRDAFEDSVGPLYPIILREGNNQADFHLCRFADTRLPRVQRSLSGGYGITLNFKTIPFMRWDAAY